MKVEKVEKVTVDNISTIYQTDNLIWIQNGKKKQTGYEYYICKNYKEGCNMRKSISTKKLCVTYRGQHIEICQENLKRISLTSDDLKGNSNLKPYIQLKRCVIPSSNQEERSSPKPIKNIQSIYEMRRSVEPTGIENNFFSNDDFSKLYVKSPSNTLLYMAHDNAIELLSINKYDIFLINGTHGMVWYG